jgi:hypothetical protein
MSSDGLTLDVYDPTNTTKLGTLSQVLSAEFSDEFNSTGFGQVEVPMSSTADVALLTKDAVVRVLYQGTARFAWFVEILERDLANSNGQQVLQAAGRGLLAWLDDAVVFPQGGLADFSSDERPFNFAAADGAWKSDYTWTTPQTVVWRNDTTARNNLPVKWRSIDPAAAWIWSTDPSALVERGTNNWFRATFTLTESTRLAMWASFDNFGQVYLDGTLVMDTSRFNETAPTYSQFTKFVTRLGKGTHTVAARVRNNKPWERTDLSISASDDKVSASNHGLAAGSKVRVFDISKSGTGLSKGNDYFLVNVSDDDFKLSNTSGGSAINITADAKIDVRLVADSTAGFLFTAWEINASNKPTNLILRSRATSWEVTTTAPKHLPAMVLRTLMEEAATRGAYRFSKFTYGFSQSAPTGGTWATKVDMTLKVGTSLLQVLDTMVDLGHDFWVNPTTSRLDAWESRGTDLSSTVTLALEDNLMEYATRAEPKLKTQALIRTKEGWTQAAANADTNGRRETYLEYGNMRDEDTARAAARKLLNRTGKTQLVATKVSAVVKSGAAPYVNFTVGDVVTVPNATGTGTLKARVLTIAMVHDGKNVRFMPELEILNA